VLLNNEADRSLSHLSLWQFVSSCIESYVHLVSIYKQSTSVLEYSIVYKSSCIYVPAISSKC